MALSSKRDKLETAIRRASMSATFDNVFSWNAEVLTGWAIHDGARVRCRAGRETIAMLPGFTNATAFQIGVGKANAFGLMREAFQRKIERGEFDTDEMKGVTLSINDLRR
jgi:hypothetical protein